MHTLIADLHLHHTPKWRLDWTDDFLNNINSFADPSSTLVLLGDVFESKNQIDSRALNQAIKLFKKWKGSIYWITGQHDTYIPNVCSLHALASNRIIIADKEPVELDDCILVPFHRDINIYKQWIETIPTTKQVFTHMPVQEAIPLDKSGKLPPASIYNRFEKTVYSGDIHNKNQYGNIRYVGATSQRDWRDAGVEGTIGKLKEDGEYIEIYTNCPKHVKIFSNATKLDPNGKYIVKIPSGFNYERSNNVLEVHEMPFLNNPELITEHKEKKIDVKQVINEYVSGQDVPNKEKVLAIGYQYIQ